MFIFTYNTLNCPLKNIPIFLCHLAYNEDLIEDNKSSILMKEVIQLNKEIFRLHEILNEAQPVCRSSSEWIKFLKRKSDNSLKAMEKATEQIKSEVKNDVNLF